MGGVTVSAGSTDPGRDRGPDGPDYPGADIAWWQPTPARSPAHAALSTREPAAALAATALADAALAATALAADHEPEPDVPATTGAGRAGAVGVHTGVPGARPWPTPLGRRGRRATIPVSQPHSRLARPGAAPRRPALGLALAVLFSLLSAFFAWVSADPVWLTLGHGSTGTAVISGCTGSGLGQRCEAGFTASNGRFTVAGAVLVAAPDPRRTGAVVPARMVSGRSHTAYAGGRTGLVLRSCLGLTLVLLCGLGVGWGTGARRFSRAGTRVAACGTALAGPLLLAGGILAASW